MNATLDAPDTPAEETTQPDTPAEETAPPTDDGDGLDPGQTTADNHGDVLSI